MWLPRITIPAVSVLALILVHNCPAQIRHQGNVTKSFTEPIETNVVAASEAGVIKSAEIKEGDRVAKGTPLAVLNSDVLIQTKRRAVAQSQSTAIRDAASATVAMLKAQKENLESLLEGGHVNQHEISQKVNEYQNAVAELQKAEDDLVLYQIEVDRIEAEIQQRIIKSPIDGFVTRIHKQIGEQLSNNEPDYATVVRLNELKAKFYLDVDTIETLQVGMSVSVLLGKQRSRTPATVMFVSPVIDPDSGTGRVEVLLDNHDYRIRSGTICYFEEQQSESRSAKSDPSRRADIR